MTCKDCIHYDTCYDRCEHWIEFELTAETECKDFKDKSRFIELPCKFNDAFYIIPTANNGFEEITRVECLGFQISKPEPVADLFRKESGKSNRLYQAGFDMFGKDIFLTREEAKEALKRSEE